MYEIWLAMNIAYEIALGLWHALLLWALVWAWRQRCCCGPCWRCASAESAGAPLAACKRCYALLKTLRTQPAGF